MDEHRALIEQVAPLIPREAAGAAWIVGGAVRDALLGRPSLDIDLAAPEAARLAAAVAQQLGSRAVAIGSDPVTWRVVAGARSYDFAPLQGESIEADLLRRDFTINAVALAIEPDARLIDPTGGAADAKRRLLRLVSTKNLDDDPLRVLRGARFAVTLDLSIEETTELELRARGASLPAAAPERVQYELQRMLEHDPAGTVRILRDLDLSAVVFGLDVDQSVEQSLSRHPSPSPAVALALIHRPLGDREAIETLRARRWSNDVALRVGSILRSAELDWQDPERHLLVLHSIGAQLSHEVAIVLTATGRENEGHALSRFLEKRQAGWWNTTPLLRGDEIAAMTGAGGATIGRLVRRLLESQLLGRVSTRAEAERIVRELTRSGED